MMRKKQTGALRSNIPRRDAQPRSASSACMVREFRLTACEATARVKLHARRFGVRVCHQVPVTIQCRRGGSHRTPNFGSTGASVDSMFLDDFTAFGHDGIRDCCSATGAVKDAGYSVLDLVSPAVREASPPTEVGDKSILYTSTWQDPALMSQEANTEKVSMDASPSG